MQKVRALALGNALSLFFLIFLCFGSESRFFNELTVSQVAALHPSVFTPFSSTYLVWGVLYAALAAFAIYHLVMAFRFGYSNPANRDTRDIGVLFMLHNIAAIGWLLLWTDNIIFQSLVLMALQLVLVVLINFKLRIHDELRRFPSKFFTQLPLSLLFGWVTISLIGNLDSYLVSTGYSRVHAFFSPAQWAIALIALTILVGITVIVRRRNVLFGLVIIWSMYSVILRSQELSELVVGGILETAWLGTGILSLVCLYQMVMNFLFENKLNQQVPEYTEQIFDGNPAMEMREELPQQR